MNLNLSLKILALFFWWYIAVFVLSVLPLVFPENNSLANFTPEFRGQVYQWDFELMFTLIFAVWGWYLWKVSRDPASHKLFIDFTIWATAAHILGMVIVGTIRPGDLSHMAKDAIALAVPLLLVIFYKRRLP